MTFWAASSQSRKASIAVAQIAVVAQNVIVDATVHIAEAAITAAVAADAPILALHAEVAADVVAHANAPLFLIVNATLVVHQ